MPLLGVYLDKKTWLAPKDTVFARISHSISRRRRPRMTKCPWSQGWREGTAGGGLSCTYTTRIMLFGTYTCCIGTKKVQQESWTFFVPIQQY